MVLSEWFDSIEGGEHEDQERGREREREEE